MIDIDPAYISEIKKTLETRIPNYEVRAFGTRVIGNARKYSDLDLAIVSKQKLDWRVIEELKDLFSESNLPFIVDVLDWNSISREFQEVIEKQYETIQKGV